MKMEAKNVCLNILCGYYASWTLFGLFSFYVLIMWANVI